MAKLSRNRSTRILEHPVTPSPTLIMLAASQRGCMINATDCRYSKPPPEDEQLIYSKHVEDLLE
jgi:hypothetical protein